MKNLFLLSLIFCLSLPAAAQENSSKEVYFHIGTRDATPALSRLTPVIPESHFNLSDPNIFQKDEERQINMLGIVERERRLKESIAEYDTPSFFWL